MIITVEELKKYDDLSNVADEQLEMMCEGIEDFIRQYTNNNFTVKGITVDTPSVNGKLETVSPLMRVGDTVLFLIRSYMTGFSIFMTMPVTFIRSWLNMTNTRVNLLKNQIPGP